MHYNQILNQEYNIMACGLRRILQISEAIKYKKIKVYNETSEITDQCKYSWSTDGVCWTNWVNIDTYDNICVNIEGDFYLRVLLFGSFSKISLNNTFTSCYNISIDSSTTFLSEFCGDPNLLQPYNNLDCALLLQQQLADSIVCMFGIPIYYFRVNPNAGATDYTFKEHFLHHIDSVKQLKLMIPDGQMPSSNPRLTEFDFDWEVDWETELSKTQFARAFGDNAYPKNGDFLYIPLMKRMWEVNSAYDEKNEGLMWRSTTWKLALVKYTEATNVDSLEYDDIIDGWVQRYSDVFEEIETNEQQRLTGSTPLSAPKHAATNLYNIFMEDAVRKQYTQHDVFIVDKTYNNKSLVVARNLYKFKNSNGLVSYQEGICGDSGTLMFIIETPGTHNGEYNDIISFGEIRVGLEYIKENKKFNIKFDKLQQQLDPFKSYIVILKWSKTDYCEELNIYEYKHPADAPVYKLKPEMYWFDFENPICELTAVYNNDFEMRDKMECKIHAYPLTLTNIKYYNIYLDRIDSIKESIKYTTKHEACVINDLARPIHSGHGYAVK